MENNEARPAMRKTSTLAVSGLDKDATIATVANACEQFIQTVKSIRLSKSKIDQSRRAMIDFFTPKNCEDAKALGDLVINGMSYSMHYARSRDAQPFHISASENKLYIKYPEGAAENEVVRMLGDVTIRKPENARNFFFATCRDMDQQCLLVKSLNKKLVTGGELIVKVAIDKTRKVRPALKRV